MIRQVTEDFIFFDLGKEFANGLDAVWVQSKKCWRLPTTLGALRELYKYTKDEQLIELGKQKRAEHERLKQLKGLDDAPGDKRLRPYQRSDIQFISGLDHCGIFNQQRTGKSLTALKVLEKANLDLNIIVCPASLLLNWKGEIEKWLPGSTIFVSKGNKTQRQLIYSKTLEGTKKRLTESVNISTKLMTQSFLIISYETLRNDLSEILKLLQKGRLAFSMTVDEAHRLANPKSKQSKAVFALGKLATKRLALTGTPTQNKGIDVWGILHFLHPRIYTSYWQFAERYFVVKDGWHGGKEISGYKREKELVELLETISTQRKRADVMAWLPPKQYITYTVEASAKQDKVYQDVLKTFEYEDDEGNLLVDAPSVLAQLTRLRQITLHPGLVNAEAPSAKEDWLKEFINDNPNEHIIIFTSFTSYLLRLEKELKGTVSLHGQMTTEQKTASVRQFQAGKSKVILCNIKAAGTGWTLDKATTTIFLDRSFNPSENAQCEDRAISTLENSVTSTTIIDLVLKDSVDQRIHQILKEKKSITEVINNYGLKGLLHD